MTIIEILEYHLIEIGGYILTPAKIATSVFILLGARVLYGSIDKICLNRFFKKRNIDVGRQFAIKAMFKYLIYTMALLWAIQSLGIQLSVIWTAVAALMVGIGLGLQQTFNDLLSGIILLTEATVEVGDIVSIEGLQGTVKRIGLRTSKVETIDEVTIIIPNSKLVGDNVINWSHTKTPTRFHIPIGVSYSSDIDLVGVLLLEAVGTQKGVSKYPEPSVLFTDFGSSSLDFKLYFHSNEYLKIESIKSEIRYKVMKLFRNNDIEIPFPQTDLWIRNSESLSSIQNSLHTIN